MMTRRPTVLVSRLRGSSVSSQPPTRNGGRNFTVGSSSTAQCRRVASSYFSSSRRYLSTSLRARESSRSRVEPVTRLDQRPDERRQGRRRVAEGIAHAVHEGGGVLRETDHVEQDEGDCQPADDLLHRHLPERSGGASAVAPPASWSATGAPADRFVPWVSQ